jgi:hypothetical protein
MQVCYEYILAGVIIFLVLATTEATMFSLMAQRLTVLEQENHYTVADQILDTLLLSPGSPSNWGNIFTEGPLSIGLADQNSLKPYVLDPYKVARLDGNSTGYISPVEARALMGLRRDWHFSLKITPILHIEVAGNGSFTITVKNNRGLLAPNVNVTAYYVPKSLTRESTYYSKSNITMVDGTCTLWFQFEQNHILVIQAEQMGVKVVTTFPEGLSFIIEGGCVFQIDMTVITEINYSTGDVSGLDKETASRYVEIGGSTFLAEFDLWR